MQPKRSFQMVSLMALLALILAACGVSTETQGGAETPASAAAEASTGAATGTEGGASAEAVASAAPAANGDMVTIRWRTRPSDAAEQQVYQELADEANQELAAEGIQIQYDPGVNQGYFEKLKTEIAASNEPDIYWIGAAELADFVNTGAVMDIKPMIDADQDFDISNFNEQTITELTRDGAIYGLPRDISTMVVYYNADLFEEAGLPTPAELAEQGNWNWETMLQSAQALTDPSKQQYGVGWGNWWGPSWGWFVNAAGGSIFNEDRTACALNTPEAIRGAEFAKQFYDEQLLPPNDAETENLFNAGKVGMMWSGRWSTPGIRENAEFNWDVAPMPEGAAESTWLFWGPYLVSANSENPEAAWKALKQITSAEAMAKVAALGTNIPARTNEEALDAFRQSTPPENNDAFLESTEFSVPEAPVWEGSWADFSSTVQQQWDQMIAGQITPEEFGQQACEQTAATFE